MNNSNKKKVSYLKVTLTDIDEILIHNNYDEWFLENSTEKDVRSWSVDRFSYTKRNSTQALNYVLKAFDAPPYRVVKDHKHGGYQVFYINDTEGEKKAKYLLTNVNHLRKNKRGYLEKREQIIKEKEKRLNEHKNKKNDIKQPIVKSNVYQSVQNDHKNSDDLPPEIKISTPQEMSPSSPTPSDLLEIDHFEELERIYMRDIYNTELEISQLEEELNTLTNNIEEGLTLINAFNTSISSNEHKNSNNTLTALKKLNEASTCIIKLERWANSINNKQYYSLVKDNHHQKETKEEKAQDEYDEKQWYNNSLNDQRLQYLSNKKGWFTQLGKIKKTLRSQGDDNHSLRDNIKKQIETLESLTQSFVDEIKYGLSNQNLNPPILNNYDVSKELLQRAIQDYEHFSTYLDRILEQNKYHPLLKLPQCQKKISPEMKVLVDRYMRIYKDEIQISELTKKQRNLINKIKEIMTILKAVNKDKNSDNNTKLNELKQCHNDTMRIQQWIDRTDDSSDDDEDEGNYQQQKQKKQQQQKKNEDESYAYNKYAKRLYQTKHKQYQGHHSKWRAYFRNEKTHLCKKQQRLHSLKEKKKKDVETLEPLLRSFRDRIKHGLSYIQALEYNNGNNDKMPKESLQCRIDDYKDFFSFINNDLLNEKYAPFFNLSRSQHTSNIPFFSQNNNENERENEHENNNNGQKNTLVVSRR